MNHYEDEIPEAVFMSASVMSSSAGPTRPVEGSGAAVGTPGAPSPYEVRRDALMAATTIALRGDYNRIDERTVQYAKRLEIFLRTGQ